MPYDDKLKMNPEGLQHLAGTVDDIGLSVRAMADFIGQQKSGFKAEALGKTLNGPEVGGSLVQAVKALQQSIDGVGKENGYLDKIAGAIRDTASAQKINEEDAKWGFDKLDNGGK